MGRQKPLLFIYPTLQNWQLLAFEHCKQLVRLHEGLQIVPVESKA